MSPKELDIKKQKHYKTWNHLKTGLFSELADRRFYVWTFTVNILLHMLHTIKTTTVPQRAKFKHNRICVSYMHIYVICHLSRPPPSSAADMRWRRKGGGAMSKEQLGPAACYATVVLMQLEARHVSRCDVRRQNPILYCIFQVYYTLHFTVSDVNIQE